MGSTDDIDEFEQTALLLPRLSDPVDMLDELSFAVTNDILYGIFHDLLLETHREAKVERATSVAAIVKEKALKSAAVVNQKALKENSNPTDEVSTGKPHPNVEIRAAGALYKDGVVYLLENPLKSSSEIICPKCTLPRLLHPTTGRGAKTPDPGIEYCKRRPFIDKDYYDVHGQTFVPKGPGRGRRKEDMIDPVMQQLKAAMPNGSQDPDTISQIPTQLKEPHAKCINCGGFQAASRMNKHMSKCIGGLSRESARNAKSKIFNANDTGSQNSYTPPGSRNSTPALGNGPAKSSPGKRSAEDEPEESDEVPKRKKKKLMKRIHLTKPKSSTSSSTTKKSSSSQMLASNLSFENKLTDNDEYDDADRDGNGNGDDTRDSNYGTKIFNRNKGTKGSSNLIKTENYTPKAKPKMLKRLVKLKKNSNSKDSPMEIRNSESAVGESRNGSSDRYNRGDVTPPTEESSQTMSSPNAE
ncbi:putative transcriptional activator [Golovinomyces cichoracearum]|uniref:Putative transcriptional activator n=1 Tax=Golovinomyces cichoracearum TaxID=62708 RepID=A0A420JAP8_9PEZI|nr:putative transcriptional activator [Golovinomyces cichoracearum]